MLLNSFLTIIESSNETSPFKCFLNTSIITGVFIVLAAWNSSSSFIKITAAQPPGPGFPEHEPSV